MRVVCCGYLIVLFLCAAAMLRQYRHELADFVQLRADLAYTPVETLRSFCAGVHTTARPFALQCQRRIATRQREDVCEVVASLSPRARRYYYLHLDCRLQSRWLRVLLPKMHYVIFS